VTEPLVLIPGFCQDARTFLPLMVHLGAERPLILLSPGPHETVEAFGAAALSALPEKFAVLGHGLGGILAIELLRQMGGFVTRIALIATDPLPETPAAAAERETRIIAARAGRLAEAMAAEVHEAALAPNDWRADVVALVQDMAAGLGPDHFVRQSRMAQRRPDRQRVLRSTKVPAMIIAGRQDTLVPLRRAEFLAGLMPFGKLAIIEDAGHLPQLEQPEALSDAVRTFLSGPMLLR
jgi:pimeloyl-ACP methyl ester carboxylesterase